MACLLLLPMLLIQIRLHDPNGRRKIFILHPSSFILIFTGYLVIMLPWFARNLSCHWRSAIDRRITNDLDVPL